MITEASRSSEVIELPAPRHDHSRIVSADTSVGTDLGTGASCARSLTSTPSVSTDNSPSTPLYSPSSHQIPRINMTTYYLYKDGKVVGTSQSCPAPRSDGGLQSPDAYEQKGDIVGAYLARRMMGRSAFDGQRMQLSERLPKKLAPATDEQCSKTDLCKSIDRNHRSDGSNDSPDRVPNLFAEHPGDMGFASQYGSSSWPHPDTIRPRHTMLTLLSHIQPERKLNALNGMCLDILEEDTSTLLADTVPKKLLVLFLGRRVVNKFIRTTERIDNVNWCGRATRQILYLPRGHSSRAAMRILVGWMTRACRQDTMENMQCIRIPGNLFAACSLAQTMELFELRRDAYRVDVSISQTQLVRPIFPVELESLWNCLGERSKYVYAAIKAVGSQIRDRDVAASAKDLPWREQMVIFLEANSQIRARVYDAKLNEEYQPVFGTQWMYTDRG